jgi:hypothetical protein
MGTVLYFNLKKAGRREIYDAGCSQSSEDENC